MDAPRPRAWFTGRFGYVRRAWGVRLGLAGYAVMVLPLLMVTALRGLGLYAGIIRSVLSTVGPVMLMLVGPALLTVGWVMTRARVRVGDIELREGSMVLRHDGAAREIAVGDVVDGVQSARGQGLELRLRGGDAVTCERAWQVGATSHDGIPPLAWALGVAPTQRASRHRTSGVASPVFRAGWTFLVLLIANLGMVNRTELRPLQFAAVSFFVLASWALASLSQGPEVTVGVDGMRVRSWRGDRFVPWREVADVAVAGRAVTATLRGGERLSLGGVTFEANRRAAARVEDLLAHVTAMRAAAGTAPETAASTARGGRTVDDWRAAMSTLLQGQYRAGAVDETSLRAVLTAGDVAPSSRVGAAMALLGHDRERHATGVRIAADALADAQLRDALRSVADGRDEAGAVDAVTADAKREA